MSLDNAHIYAYNVLVRNKEVTNLKRNDLINLLEQNGFSFHRAGGNHDIYKKDSIMIPIPRHREIAETTAKKILKEAGL